FVRPPNMHRNQRRGVFAPTFRPFAPPQVKTPPPEPTSPPRATHRQTNPPRSLLARVNTSPATPRPSKSQPTPSRTAPPPAVTISRQITREHTQKIAVGTAPHLDSPRL